MNPIKRTLLNLLRKLTLSVFLQFFIVSPSHSERTSLKTFRFEISRGIFPKDRDTIPSINSSSFFVSNRGSDSNDGRSAATPKLHITSIEPLLPAALATGSFTTLNLEQNSLFREQFDPTQGNLFVNSFGQQTSQRLAKITGMDIIKDWKETPTTNYVFQHALKNSIDVSNSGYSSIIIAEIDTTLEKTHPISAVRYLTFVADITKCSNTPGSYYTPKITTGSVMVYIHPTEGTPGTNKFRYEVTTRDNNINGFYVDNATYENLFLQSSAYGYGMLSGGKNTLVKNILFQGGGIHHTVIKSGQIDSCLFLPGPKGLADRIAAVFYNAEGTGANNKITNSIFLNVPNAVYTHTNGEINHKSLLLDNVYAFADTTDASNGLSSGNTDSVVVSNCYVEGYPSGWYGGITKTNINHSIFRNTNQSAIMVYASADVNAEVKVSDVLIKTNGNDNNQSLVNGRSAYGLRSPYGNVKVEVSNSIIHGYSTWHEMYSTITAFQVSGIFKAHHNIYICDVNDDNSIYMYYADNSSGRGTATNITSNYNAYILVRGSKFSWIVKPNINNESGLSTLSEWQSLTGQDMNSVFIDLRNNPLGLKAIFVDPENGNYSLTQTPEAESVRKISAGSASPPLFYPLRPSVNNAGMLPYKLPGGFSGFSGTANSESESLLQWQTYNESEFSSFIVEYSLDGTHFMAAKSMKAINNTKNNTYQLVHTHLETDSIFYRLKLINMDSSALYSSVVKLKSILTQQLNLTIYPNPFQQTITVAHPRRNAAEIRIYDYTGRLLKITTVLANASKTPVSLSELPGGRYFVQWISNKDKLSGTVIK